MRTSTTLLIAFATATAGLWIGHQVGRPGKPAAAAPRGGGGGGRGDTRLSAGAGDDGAARSFSEEAAKALRALERGRPVGPAARARGLIALATLHAVAGNDEEFLRLAALALAEGAAIDDLLAAVRELPVDRRGAVLAALLDRAPDAAFDTVEVARMLADAGQGERALALVRRALPRQGGLRADLARLLLRLDPEGGTRVLFELEGSERWDADTLGVLRALLVEAGREDRLLPFLTRALDERPGDHGALRGLRRLDPAAALARVMEWLGRNPDDPWAWTFVGEVRRDGGDPAGAFDAFRKAAERHPSRGTFRDLMRSDPVRGLTLVLGWTKDSVDDEMIGAQAHAYLLAGRKDDARRAFLRAHEHDPGDGEWIDELIALDAAVAVEALERRIAPAPGAASDRVLGRYAQALEAAGRRTDAFAQYLAAHRKDPGDGEWQRALVALDARGALPVLEAHLRDQPADASGHGAYGIALVAAGRGAEAVEHLERALAQGDAGRWYAALQKVDDERALAGLRRRAEADGDDADVWGLLGRELRGRRLDAEARSAYERAASLDPANREWALALREVR